MRDLKIYGQSLVTFRRKRNWSLQTFANKLRVTGFQTNSTQLHRWESTAPFPYSSISLKRLEKLISSVEKIKESESSFTVKR